jgi:tetratricopeptide (TPR) repeat protein
MIGWLRLVLMIFYAPLRGMREARDRGSLLPIAVSAFLSQAAYNFIVAHFVGARLGGLSQIWGVLFHAAMTAVLIAIVIVPLLALVANLFDRRGSFRVVITQEYASLAGTMFYVLTATNIATIAIAAFFHYSGIQAAHVNNVLQQLDQIKAMMPASFEAIPMSDPAFIASGLFRSPKLLLFAIGIVLTVKEVFRFSVLRSLGVSIVAVVAAVIVSPVWQFLFSHIIGSPFLFFLVFMLLRGYFTDFMGQQRAKAALKRNLESATLNPADASAHYNLGLIHQSRGDFDQATESFKRALEIDPDEVDASYQLGRIARSQKRYAEAIQYFEQVVARNPAHSLHEVWREVAATYIAAGQFEDARTALEQFLEHRPSDPEGLYLMGRAHAGLGHRREATSLMQQCIEAVKTAPAYKYRSSKRWMTEAEQFIKGSGGQ